MMSFVGGDFSSTSDSDSIESSSSSSSSSDSRKPKIQSYEEKPDAVKEASPGHSKEKQAANTEDRKAGKERKEDVQEKNAQKKERKKPAPQKSTKIKLGASILLGFLKKWCRWRAECQLSIGAKIGKIRPVKVHFVATFWW